ncbi:MAG: flagellar biosynthesis protein FlhB [Phycisphaerales bacterium]
MAEELGEKTEAPSGRKLSDARKKGQIARSHELSGAIDLIGAVVLLIVFGGGLMTDLLEIMREVLAGKAPGAAEGLGGVPRLLGWISSRTGLSVAPFMGVMFLIVLGAQLMQVQWLLTLEPLMPKLERLNPIKGVGKLFSRRNLLKTLVAVVKLSVITAVVLLAVMRRFPELAALPVLGLVPAFNHMGAILLEVAAWMLALMLVIGAADYLYQRWQHTQDLKMTKQEVKDERKSSEGDVDVKGRRMRMARSMLVQQMRQSVPQADVVVTNPTHFSVAIKYDETMAAPRVVAKGADYMAFRIREIAAAHGVPIVEKPALARAMYARVDVGREVQPEFYQAVAEVLAYVYRLNQHAAA